MSYTIYKISLTDTFKRTWLDGQVQWVDYRDLEDGVSPDSQPIGGYLGHALGKLETRRRTALKRRKPAKIK